LRAQQTHERLAENQVVRGSSNRSFGLTFALLFMLFGIWPVLRGLPLRVWALVIAAAFSMAALVLPRTLAPLNRCWLAIGLLLHACVSSVIMRAVFYTTVTPIGLVGRLLGKDPLRLRLDRDAATYWIDRHPPGPAPDTMPRQF